MRSTNFNIVFELLPQIKAEEWLSCCRLRCYDSNHNLPEFLYSVHLLISVDGEVQLPLLPYCSPSTLLSKVSIEYQEVLAEFPEIVGLGFAPMPTKHDVCHHVVTKGPPISTPARRLNPQKYATAKAKFERMEKAGIVRGSNSPWASTLHMVPKQMVLGAPVEILTTFKFV